MFHMNEHLKIGMDTLSVATVLASLAAWLPPAAAAASLVWTLIRIWETKTVQSWRSRRRSQRCAVCEVRKPLQGGEI